MECGLFVGEGTASTRRMPSRNYQQVLTCWGVLPGRRGKQVGRFHGRAFLSVTGNLPRTGSTCLGSQAAHPCWPGGNNRSPKVASRYLPVRWYLQPVRLAVRPQVADTLSSSPRQGTSPHTHHLQPLVDPKFNELSCTFNGDVRNAPFGLPFLENLFSSPGSRGLKFLLFLPSTSPPPDGYSFLLEPLCRHRIRGIAVSKSPSLKE